MVGEALSRGGCVIASNEVGSAEPVARGCCRTFPAGNMNAFERQARELMNDLRSDDELRLRRLAVEEARRNFDPELVGRELVSLLEQVVAARRPAQCGAVSDHEFMRVAIERIT